MKHICINKRTNECIHEQKNKRIKEQMNTSPHEKMNAWTYDQKITRTENERTIENMDKWMNAFTKQ